VGISGEPEPIRVLANALEQGTKSVHRIRGALKLNSEELKQLRANLERCLDVGITSSSGVGDQRRRLRLVTLDWFDTAREAK
jgi:hypothetical protein